MGLLSVHNALVSLAWRTHKGGLLKDSFEFLVYHFPNLVEEEVIDVVGEEGSELARLGLAWSRVHLYLVNEPGQNSQYKQKLEQLGHIDNITPDVNVGQFTITILSQEQWDAVLWPETQSFGINGPNIHC